MNRLFEGNTRFRRDVEKVACVHPRLGFVEHLPCVRQRHDAFADAESPNIDLVTKPLGHLSDEVALVAFRFDVDIALRFDEGAHVALDVRRIHIAMKHEGHHESRRDDPAKAVLFQEI